MIITHEITMDLKEQREKERIYAMQGDANTRAVCVTLLCGGEAWQIPENTYASVAFYNEQRGCKGWYDTLPDSTAACTISGNVVTAVLAPAVFAGDGWVQAAVILQDRQQNQLATCMFSVWVEKNAAVDSALHNDYYAYSTVAQMNEAVLEALASLEDSKTQMRQQVDEAVEGMQQDMEAEKTQIQGLLSQVRDSVGQMQQEAGPAIVCQASGELVTVSDASHRPLQGLSIYGKTTQDGTPTPDAPVALENAGGGGSIGVTVAGKNIISPLTASVTKGGVTFTPQEDGSFVVNGTATEYAWIKIGAVRVKAGETYTLSGCVGGSGSTYQLYMADDNIKLYSPYPTYPQAAGVAARSGFSNVYFVVYTGTTVTNLVVKPQLEIGEAATAYEPYTKQDITVATPNGLPGIPVSSGGNYTDNDGQQWICDEVNFARGVYVQRVGKVDFANATATYSSSGMYLVTLPDGLRVAYPSNNALCSHYPFAAHENSTMPDKCFKVHYNGANIYAYLKDSDYADGISWKTHLVENSVSLLYQLASPIETPLSAEELAAYAALHTNKPNTTVMNDAGAGLGLAYIADTKTYMDNKFTEITNAIVAMGGTI